MMVRQQGASDMIAQWILNDIWNEGFEDGLSGYSGSELYAAGEERAAYNAGWILGNARRHGRIAA